MKIKLQSGIYKITSPSGKIYIGQSININKRRTAYNTSKAKGQSRLFNSIKKYGWDKHIFEVIEICDVYNLNERERFFIKQFDSFNSKHGLNLRSGGHNSIISDESKRRMSIAKTGRVVSDSTRQKMSASAKGRVSWCLGLTHSTETISRMSETHKRIHQQHLRGRIGSDSNAAKSVINIETGFIYPTLSQACIDNDYKLATLSYKLNGKIKNNTKLQYL